MRIDSYRLCDLTSGLCGSAPAPPPTQHSGLLLKSYTRNNLGFRASQLSKRGQFPPPPLPLPSAFSPSLGLSPPPTDLDPVSPIKRLEPALAHRWPLGEPPSLLCQTPRYFIDPAGSQPQRLGGPGTF